MRIRLDSIGCRLNIGEIEALARRLASDGHRVVAQGESADLCILNTCTVTAIASRKSRHFIRQLRRSNPGGRIVATGCLAELEPETVKALGVDLVVGNNEKDDIPGILTRRGLLTETDLSTDAAEPPSYPTGRTRAFLKVQDGCDNRCTFCIVTIARGRGRSRPMDAIVAEVRKLCDLGYREVVLSGVHLGSYGHDSERVFGLEDLIRAILSETDLPRLRVSSIEPWDIHPDFFKTFEDPRLLPHLHLPLQSGCDATLERMARKTTLQEFTDLVAAARAAVDDLSVSTDVMVGFPGETESDFETSLAAVEELEFSRLHIFRYSPREGTLAASMAGQVSGPESQDRSRRMHKLGEQLSSRFHKRHLGRTMQVLWETVENVGTANRWSGLTGNYIRVLAEAAEDVDLVNRFSDVVLEECIPGAVSGSILGFPGIEGASRGVPVGLPVVGDR